MTLTATTPQGGVATGVAELKVTKPKLKFGAVKLEPRATAPRPEGHGPRRRELTIAGKGVTPVKEKARERRR